MAIAAKNEPVVETEENTEETVKTAPVSMKDIPFTERYGLMCRAIHEEAPRVLKFDSMVDNIDYEYVDTQQYKSFIAMMADRFDISFGWSCKYANLERFNNDKGKFCFQMLVTCQASFYDFYNEEVIDVDACGFGVSIGNNYAMSVAQTNAIRNFITNNFLLPTNDRDNDDMRNHIDTGAFLTDKTKAQKRDELLEKTKSDNKYATVAYGKVLYGRIQETLEKDVPEDFRARLEKFAAAKFTDGEPTPAEDAPNMWCVTKKAAAAVMSDLDSYNG